MTTVNINSHTYNTTNWPLNRVYLVEFPALANDVGIVANQVVASAASAAASAVSAAAVVANAMATTSTTSLSIGTGAKVFTTAANLDTAVPFVDQMWVKAVSISDASKYMVGTVTSATGTTLTTNITATNGSGTVTDWSIFATGAPGLSATLDVHGQTTVSAQSVDDEILIYSAVDTATRKVSRMEFLLFNQIFSEVF